MLVLICKVLIEKYCSGFYALAVALFMYLISVILPIGYLDYCYLEYVDLQFSSGIKRKGRSIIAAIAGLFVSPIFYDVVNKLFLKLS